MSSYAQELGDGCTGSIKGIWVVLLFFGFFFLKTDVEFYLYLFCIYQHDYRTSLLYSVDIVKYNDHFLSFIEKQLTHISV